MGREGIGLGDWEGTIWECMRVWVCVSVSRCLPAWFAWYSTVQCSSITAIIGIPQKASTHTITYVQLLISTILQYTIRTVPCTSDWHLERGLRPSRVSKGRKEGGACRIWLVHYLKSGGDVESQSFAAVTTVATVDTVPT